ncbi:MAG: DUF6062 family protein [Defluviitaleaceae bacterium]|nr:DUF6062 family protein [Defluviitaleaceae bacterium]
MKETIYTIPITDAFARESECPFCAMFRKLEDDAVDFITGPACMDDDVRMLTNEAGFCAEHYRRLYAGQNRLPLALLLQTHIQRINRAFPKDAPAAKARRFGKRDKAAEPSITAELRKFHGSCYICGRVKATFERYIDNFFYMWKHMPEFAETVKNCRGFCLEHFADLMEAGEKLLSADEYRRFAEAVLPLQRDAMRRLEADVDRFVAKFDYRNADMPWDGAQDAVVRAIARLASADLGPKP